MKLVKKIISKIIMLLPILFLLGIIIYTFINGFVFLGTEKLLSLAGFRWNPTRQEYGIFSMFIGSGLITILAIMIATPISLIQGITISEYLPKNLKILFRSLLLTYAAIPPIIYGFWGLMTIVPIIKNVAGGSGYSILGGGIVLALMIMPTITAAVDISLQNISNEYREASISSGATNFETLYYIILPIARPGILTGVLLGLGRAIGETTTVLLLTGNVTAIPDSIFSPGRTLTATIALELGEAAGEHRQSIFAIAFILIIVIIFTYAIMKLVINNFDRPY